MSPVGDLARLYGTGAVAMSFHGGYRFATTEDLDAAIAAVQEMLGEEDSELAAGFERGLRRRGKELRIELDTRQPSDWYYTYATLVEALAERAVGGTVESALAGNKHVESYVAASPSQSLTKMKRVVERPTWDGAARSVAKALYEISGEIRVPIFSDDVRSADDVPEPARDEIVAEAVRSADELVVRPTGTLAHAEPVREVAAETLARVEPIAAAAVRPARVEPVAAAAVRPADTHAEASGLPVPAGDVRRPDTRSSVADKVAAATVELTRVPSLMTVPELSSLGSLMTLPPLAVPSLVLVSELLPPGDVAVVARSMAVAASAMIDELGEGEDEGTS